MNGYGMMVKPVRLFSVHPNLYPNIMIEDMSAKLDWYKYVQICI